MMSGLELSGRFYAELIRPLLADIPHAAARLGSGSDVLGLDDIVSRDHDWGCRLTLLLESAHHGVVGRLLEANLPCQFLGHPVRFATTWDPGLRHRAEINTVRAFAFSRLGHIPQTPVEWLLIPGQSFLEVTAGAVFHDAPGELTDLRRELEWYPHDLWLYTLASGWNRLAQEVPLAARSGQRGDGLAAARLTRYLGQLAYLLERRWSPYAKWFGVMLRQSELGRQICQADLLSSLSLLHQKMRDIGLSTTTQCSEPFFDRGYFTVNPAIAQELLDMIQDPAVRALPTGLGSIEQWCDNTSLLMDPNTRLRAASIYAGAPAGTTD